MCVSSGMLSILCRVFVSYRGMRALVQFVAAGLLCAPMAYAQAHGSVAEQYLFAQANAERAQRGLPQLRWDGALYRAAQTHAKEMALRQSISHQYPGEPELSDRGRAAGARFSVIAENVAEAPTAVRIHDAWMNSPGHRANLLDAQVDSVGISVLSRNGQLYAVEDFDRSVANLSLEEQEHAVQALLGEAVPIEVLPTSDQVRQTCLMDTGFAGDRRPGFVMRYTAGELTRLPDALKTRLSTGKYRQAEVGACMAKDSQAFSTFKIAVVLYP